jgi:ribosome biogenesis SPOUT family RNA methylase Rps3
VREVKILPRQLWFPLLWLVLAAVCAAGSAALLGVPLGTGCSSPRENPDVEVKSVETEVVKSRDRGEPIYSTSVAIRMAELILKERGLSFDDRSVLVSFCEGIYTVTFEKPSDQPASCDYKVEIDADTSKILKVVTTR